MHTCPGRISGSTALRCAMRSHTPSRLPSPHALMLPPHFSLSGGRPHADVISLLLCFLYGGPCSHPRGITAGMPRLPHPALDTPWRCWDCPGLDACPWQRATCRQGTRRAGSKCQRFGPSSCGARERGHRGALRRPSAPCSPRSPRAKAGRAAGRANSKGGGAARGAGR